MSKIKILDTLIPINLQNGLRRVVLLFHLDRKAIVLVENLYWLVIGRLPFLTTALVALRFVLAQRIPLFIAWTLVALPLFARIGKLLTATPRLLFALRFTFFGLPRLPCAPRLILILVEHSIG